MILFEITTGRMGESYERCYVWASNETQAIQLYLLRYQDLPEKVRPLFNETDAQFITSLSDSGFNDEEV
jgi:hypothetical protein